MASANLIWSFASTIACLVLFWILVVLLQFLVFPPALEFVFGFLDPDTEAVRWHTGPTSYDQFFVTDPFETAPYRFLDSPETTTVRLSTKYPAWRYFLVALAFVAQVGSAFLAALIAIIPCILLRPSLPAVAFLGQLMGLGICSYLIYLGFQNEMILEGFRFASQCLAVCVALFPVYFLNLDEHEELAKANSEEYHFDNESE